MDQYTWGCNYVILLSTVTVAMLEVYLLLQFNVEILRVCGIIRQSKNTVCE